MWERVSCDWTASSRVGARTRTRTGDFDFEFLGLEEEEEEETRRARAGIPKARVFPL